jgi:Raf kinase inhibitor-like YbhB/YbcL family protein
MTFHLTSPSFADGQPSPARHTSDDEDVSPALHWTDPPLGTKSFALVVHDPDAPDPRASERDWVRWVLYDLPADVWSLAEGVTNTELPPGTREGRNDWGETGWRGRARPSGATATSSSCTRSTARCPISARRLPWRRVTFGAMPTPELFALLGDPDPATRVMAAVAIADVVSDEDLQEVLAQIAKYDVAYPGVADAFYGCWGAEGFASTETRERAQRWMLQVLGARKPETKLSPIAGNNLVFHAHEQFDDDSVALSTLLGWGYTHLVHMALDHCALPRVDWIRLVEALYAKTRESDLLECLAVTGGVIHPDLAAVAGTIVFPAGEPALMLSAVARFWEARWLFPRARPIKLDMQNAQALFDGLVAAGLGLGPVTTAFDATQTDRVAFPALPGAMRETARVRSDVEMTVAFDADGAVAVRLVRSKGAGESR